MPRARVLGRLLSYVVAGAIPLWACASAGATSAALHVTLDPLRLGHGTTVGFELRLTSNHGLPKRLTEFGVSYPEALGIGLSGLGLMNCELQTLETRGPAACPNESVMGYGTAVAEIPYGSQLLPERMRVTIFRGPTENGVVELLVHVVGSSPAIAEMTFPGQLASAPAPFGGQIQATLPAVAGLPGGPGVAVVRFSAAIGPLHVLYHERMHGRLVTFHPKGILLPNHCPVAGFRFVAHLTFEDGSHLSVGDTVPCPRSSRSRPTRSQPSSAAPATR